MKNKKLINRTAQSAVDEFLFIRKIVHSALTFLLNKKAPRGCDQMHGEYGCHGQSASGAGAGGFLTDRVQERDREYRSS